MVLKGNSSTTRLKKNIAGPPGEHFTEFDIASIVFEANTFLACIIELLALNKFLTNSLTTQ